MARLVVLWALALCGDEEPDYKIQFKKCETTKQHIAIQLREGVCGIHFHMLVENLKGKEVFAKIRCIQKDGKREKSYEELKVVDIAYNEEFWKVNLIIPQSKNVLGTYQVEVGYKDPSQVDEFIILDAFAWQLKGANISFGTDKEPLFLPINSRVVVADGNSWKIVSKTHATMYTSVGKLACAIVKNLVDPVSPDAWMETLSVRDVPLRKRPKQEKVYE